MSSGKESQMDTSTETQQTPSLPEPGQPALQPLLHELLVTTMAPTQVWSGRDGQIRGTGAQGMYHADVRVISEAVLTVDGVEPELLRSGHRGAGVSEAFLALRMIDGPGPDPTAWVRRRREVIPG